MSDLVIYDVCNDYTLKPAPERAWPSAAYRTIKTKMGFVYIHRRDKEIHYLIGAPGLAGQRLDISDEDIYDEEGE